MCNPLDDTGDIDPRLLPALLPRLRSQGRIVEASQTLKYPCFISDAIHMVSAFGEGASSIGALIPWQPARLARLLPVPLCLRMCTWQPMISTFDLMSALFSLWQAFNTKCVALAFFRLELLAFYKWKLCRRHIQAWVFSAGRPRVSALLYVH